MKVGDVIFHINYPGSKGTITELREKNAKIAWENNCEVLSNTKLYLLSNLLPIEKNTKEFWNNALEIYEKIKSTASTKDETNFDFHRYNGFSERTDPPLKPFISFSDYNGFERSAPKYRIKGR